MTMADSSDFGPDAFLCHQVLRQMERASDGKKTVYETEFNKLCFLTYKELEEEGFADEVQLPMHWYQFGMKVWGQPDALAVLYNSDNRGTEVIPQTLSESAFALRDELKEAIHRVTRQLAGEYKFTFGTDAIIDDSYDEHAPTPFVKSYHEYRRTIEELEPGQQSLANFVDSGSTKGHISTIRPHLETLVSEYPKSTYNEAYAEFKQWDSVTRQLAKNGDVDALIELSKAFWKMFSRVELRIHHNVDIPSETVADWIMEREQHKQEFRSQLAEYRQIAVANREQTNHLKQVSDEYSETVRDMAHDESR